MAHFGNAGNYIIKRKHMVQENTSLEIIEYTDPYCTWCWGSEPVLRKIQETYGDQIRIIFRMGGLVENISKFYDSLNKIGGSNWYQQVAAHWLDASQRHGMPVDERVWYDIKDEFRSTYPANIAYKSAEFQNGERAIKFLRRMREAAAAERQAIHRLEVQVELVQKSGLDSNKFMSDIENGKAEAAFHEDLLECRGRGITGFPTFLIRNAEGQEILLHGYQKFPAFERVIQQLGDNSLASNPILVDEYSILGFVRKYEKVSLKEVAEVFNITVESTMEWIAKLKEKGLVIEHRAGNGFFYLAQNIQA